MTMIAILNDIPFEQSHTIDVENSKPFEFSMSELQEIRKKIWNKKTRQLKLQSRQDTAGSVSDRIRSRLGAVCFFMNKERKPEI